MQSAPRAFARLERALPSLRGRKFYGIVDVRAIEYQACVRLQEGDDPEAAGAVSPADFPFRSRVLQLDPQRSLIGNLRRLADLR